MSDSSSSGGVDPTGPTETPTTGESPTALAPGSDSSGGPQIPGTPGLPVIPETPEGGFPGTAGLLGASAVEVGVAIAVASAPAGPAAPLVAAVGATAFLIASLQQPDHLLAPDESHDGPATGQDLDGDGLPDN
jgi:hypothetical protein